MNDPAEQRKVDGNVEPKLAVLPLLDSMAYGPRPSRKRYAEEPEAY